jgi:hypothetical protein
MLQPSSAMLSNKCLLDVRQYSISSAVVKSGSRLAREAAKIVAFDSFCSRCNLLYPIGHMLRFWQVARHGNEVVASLHIKQGVANEIDELIELPLNIVRSYRVAVEYGAEDEYRKPRDKEAHSEIVSLNVATNIIECCEID